MSVGMEQGMDQPVGPPSQVVHELVQQAELITTIHQAMNELEKRLNGVLKNEEDATEKALSDPHITLVPIAEMIYDHNRNLRLSSMRLYNILDRLEL